MLSRPDEGAFVPNTGLFYLYEVSGKPRRATEVTCESISSVRAECLSCHEMISMSSPPLLVNIAGGGAALQCPSCGVRQAVSGARFADLIQRSSATPPTSNRQTSLDQL